MSQSRGYPIDKCKAHKTKYNQSSTEFILFTLFNPSGKGVPSLVSLRMTVNYQSDSDA